jgi:integrase/recombinase XerD
MNVLVLRHEASDPLRAYLGWCAERGLAPLGADRRQLELYVRGCSKHAGDKRSTVFRRTSLLSGFYRTCVIDGVLEHFPATYIR